MEEKLQAIEERLNAIMKELEDPEVVKDQDRFKSLMKEQSDITPIVEKYFGYDASSFDYTPKETK